MTFWKSTQIFFNEKNAWQETLLLQKQSKKETWHKGIIIKLTFETKCSHNCQKPHNYYIFKKHIFHLNILAWKNDGFTIFFHADWLWSNFVTFSLSYIFLQTNNLRCAHITRVFIKIIPFVLLHSMRPILRTNLCIKTLQIAYFDLHMMHRNI